MKQGAVLPLPGVGPLVGHGLDEQYLRQAGENVHHPLVPLTDEEADHFIRVIVEGGVRLRRQPLQVLVVRQREVGADVEPQAQLVGDDAGHALEERLCLGWFVDGGLVAAGADAPAVGQADVVGPHRHAAHVTARRRLLALAADGDGLVI